MGSFSEAEGILLVNMSERDLRVEGVEEEEERISEGGRTWPKQGSLLHYNNRKLRPLAKTCCATSGVIVYTKGSEIEEGATGKKGTERKDGI